MEVEMASSVGMGYKTVKVTATGAALGVRVGIKPRKVVCHNLTNGYKAEWNEALADDSALVTSDAGARSVVSSAGFSLLAGSSSTVPGFSLGALANVNDTTTEDLLFEVYGGYTEKV